MLTCGATFARQLLPITTVVRPRFCRTYRLSVRASGAPNDRYCFVAPGEAATQRLASVFARDLRPGDCYCLLGEVGVGKSVFSRAFIREAEEDDELPVPSPTYLLQELYEEHAGPPIHHFDMYRLDPGQNMERLNLVESYRTAVSLIEWADRLQYLPSERLDVHFHILDASDRAQIGGVSAEGTNDIPKDKDECDYVDREWRKICLHPVGEVWKNRVCSVVDSLKGSSAANLTGLSTRLQDEPKDQMQ